MMVGPRIFISHTQEAAQLANELVSHVAQYMEPMVTNTSIPRESKQQWLANKNVQWFILVRTDAAIQQNSPVFSEVEAALNLYTGGQLQGVLAIAADQTEAEDIPPRWSTIRTYNGATIQDRTQAFNSIVKTLSYHAKISANNASIPTQGQTQSPVQQYNPLVAQASNSRVMNWPSWLSGLIFPIGLLVFIVAIVAAFVLSSGLLNTPSQGTTIITPPGTSTATTPVNSTTPTSSTATTPTQQQLTQANDLFKESTQGNAVLTLASTDSNKTSLWDNNLQCALSPDNKTYTITTPLGQPQVCKAAGTNFTNNFAYQVTMNIHHGGYAGGLIFRFGGDNKRYYRFFLDNVGNNGLTLVKSSSALQPLKSFDSHTNGWHPNQPNTLTVILSKDVIYLYVNGKYIDQYTPQKNEVDGSSGQICVYATVSTDQQMTIIDLSDLKVWKLP